jgi:hypothetical protein
MWILLKYAYFVVNSSFFRSIFGKYRYMYTQHRCGTYFSAFLEMDYKR